MSDLELKGTNSIGIIYLFLRKVDNYVCNF